MQNEITTPGDLLDEQGHLTQRGWARKPLLRYNPENLKVGWHRLKEWDFYGVYTKEHGFSFFIADLGYFSLIAVTFFDFVAKQSRSTGTVKLFTKGKLGLSRSSLAGDFTFETKGFGRIGEVRTPSAHELVVDCPKFKGFSASVSLAIDPSKDSMVVATGYPDDKPNCFYYNHKTNLLPATGTMRFDGKEYAFTPDDAHGGFDWGRGVWPYKTRWLWGTGAGHVDGHDVWFNIGYGFGDLSTHTENMVFVDGKCHKLDGVTFHTKKKKTNQAWSFTSTDGRFEAELLPLVDISNYANMGFMMTDSNNLHGAYGGKVVLDDGTVLELHDFRGHAEDIRYRW